MHSWFGQSELVQQPVVLADGRVLDYPFLLDAQEIKEMLNGGSRHRKAAWYRQEG